MPPPSGPKTGSAVSVDRPGPPAKSADGAAHHPSSAVSWPPDRQSPLRGRPARPGWRFGRVDIVAAPAAR